MNSTTIKIKNMEQRAMENKAVFLPQWHPENRGAPNEIVRSALFNARNKNQKRENFKQYDIAIIGNGHIKYTGEELRQDDETVWLQVLHLAREKPLEESIQFSAYAILKSLNWPTTAFYYQKLEECLNRMVATNLIIESNRLGKACGVSIIRKYEKNKDGKMWNVWIEKEMKFLFDGNYYTLTEWNQRLALPLGMATWLHSYLASHKKPYDIKIETVIYGAGLNVNQKKHAVETIKKALNNLVNVGFLTSWQIKDDKISVKRANGSDDATSERIALGPIVT